MIEKAIFIFGSGRCGTNWLRHWLLQHPDTFGEFNESRLFDFIAQIVRTPKTIYELGLEHEFKKMHISTWLPEDRMLELTSDYVYNIFDNATSRGDKSCVVEKTPRHAWHVELINKLLQHKCKVYHLHIYRDGRNVLESFMRQPWFSWKSSLARKSVNWIREMTHMLNGDFPSNTMHVKYEDLITNPEVSRKITTFCDMPHHFDIKPFIDRFSQFAILEFDPNRWKSVTEPEVLDLFNQMNATLSQLGYPVDAGN